ncbi:hypothetical protein llap_430 [Limosa lapponica baueri]|uniref:Uncharacterized protein n=1 Tax=Limosa lapponica baueri TaxID=1758121 RepID=A0A2I0UT58_LIMLA|nr:hypothetical protein llap_430 [Limosa lapponica baueri]
MQTPASEHLQVGAFITKLSSTCRIWNGKTAGTAAEMLCVGEITLRERPEKVSEKGIKKDSHVETWKRKEEKITLTTGQERRKRCNHRYEMCNPQFGEHKSH